MALTNQELIELYRRSRPDLTVSDDLILGQFWDRANRAGTLDQFPELKQWAKDAERANRPGLVSELGRGIARGVDQFQGALYSGGEMIGDAVGWEGLAQRARAGVERNRQEAAMNAPSVASVEDVESVGDALYLAAGTTGQALPGMAATLAASAIAAAAAPAVGIGAGATGLTGLAVRGLSALGMGAPGGGVALRSLASAGAAGLSGFTQMQNYSDLKDQGASQGDAFLGATFSGAVGAALEPLVPLMLAGRVTKALSGEATKTAARKVLGQAASYAPARALAAYGQRFAQGTAMEGATEFGQELAAIGGELWANRDNPDYTPDADEFKSRLLNAAIGGGLVGGVFDVGFTAVSRSLEEMPRAIPEAPAAPEARASLGERAELQRQAMSESRQFLYQPGDSIRVVGENVPAGGVGEIVEIINDPQAGPVYVVQLGEQTARVPEIQVRPFDPRSAEAQAENRERRAAVEASLKQELITPEVQEVLRQDGLTEDEILTWTPDELLKRYAEARDRRPVAPLRPPAEVTYRDEDGRLVTRVPAAGTELQLNLFGPPEVNTPPTNIGSAAELQAWREGQIKARANENLARLRGDRDALGDLSVGPIAPINPAAAEGMTFNTDGRQTLMDFEGSQLEAQAERELARQEGQEAAELEAEVSRTEAVAMNRADLMADVDSLVSFLTSRGSDEDSAVRIANAMVQSAGGWDNPRTSIARQVAAIKRADAATARAVAAAERAEAKAREREARVRKGLEDLGASPELIDSTLAAMQADPAKAQETLAAARIQLREQAVAERQLALNAEREQALAVARGETQELADAYFNLRTGWMTELGPIAYAEVFGAQRLTEGPLKDRILRNAAGRKAIAFVEDGRVVLRRVERGSRVRKDKSGASRRESTLLVSRRRRSDLKKGEAFEQIKALVPFKVSDSTIEKALSPDPKRFSTIRRETREAIQRANETVKYDAADNVPLEDHLSQHDVVGFVTAADDRLDIGYVSFASPELFARFASDIRNNEVNEASVDSDPDAPAAQEAVSLDQVTEAGSVGNVVADERASDAADMAEAADVAEITESLFNAVRRIRDAQVGRMPFAEDLWKTLYSKDPEGARRTLREVLDGFRSEDDAKLLRALSELGLTAERNIAARVVEKLKNTPVTRPIKAPRQEKIVTPEPAANDPVPSPAPSSTAAADYIRSEGYAKDEILELAADVERMRGAPLEKQVQSARPLIALARDFYARLAEPVPFPTEPAAQLQKAMEFAGSAIDGMLTVRPEPGLAFRPGATNTALRFNDAVRSAAAMGYIVNVVKLRQDIADGFFNVDGGRIRPDGKTIDLVLAELTNPSRSDLIKVFHEVMHGVVANAPAHVKSALHTAFANMAANPEALAQFQNPEADVRLQSGLRPADMSPDVWLEENFVEDRALRWVDKGFARNVFAKAWRSLKEIYYRVLAWIQANGGGVVDPAVAVGLVEARFSKFAAGDYLHGSLGETSIFSRTSDRKVMRNRAEALAGVDAVRVDPRTGTISYLEAAGETEAEAAYNVNIPREQLLDWVENSGFAEANAAGLLSSEGEQSESGAEGLSPGDISLADVKRTFRAAADSANADFQAQIELYRAKTLSNARVQVAANNTMHWRLVMAYNAAKAEGKAPDTFDAFRKALKAPDYLAARDAAIKAVRDQGFDDVIPTELSVDDLTLPGDKDRAELKVAQLASSINERVAKAEAEARSDEANLRETYNESVEELKRATSEVKSLAITRANIREEMREQIDLLRRHVRTSERLAGRDAALLQTIEDLEGSLEEKVYEAYDKFLKAVRLDDATMLDQLIDAALEVRSGDRFAAEMSASEFFEAIKVMAQNRSDLDPFFDQSRPGKPSPLVAAVHRYLVKQELITDGLRAARMSADAQQRLVAGMREIMKVTTDTELNALKEAVSQDSAKEVVRLFKARNGTERLVFNKVLRTYFKKVASNQAIARQIRSAEKTVVAASYARPLLRELRTAAEQRMEAQLDFSLGDNVDVIVPSSAADTPEDLLSESRLKKYNAATTGGTSNRTVASWMQAQSRWLKARQDSPELQDKLYFTVKAQNEGLRAHLQSEFERSMKTGLFSGYFAGVTSFLRNTGTRAGQIAASRWVRYDDLQRRWNGRDRNAGREWGVALDRLVKATGLPSRAQAEALFFQPMAHVVNSIPSEEGDAFRFAIAQIQLNPIARDALKRPGAMDAMRAFFNASVKATDFLSAKIKESNVKVAEKTIVSIGTDGESSEILRRQVQRGFRTFPRHLSQLAQSVVHQMRSSLSDVYNLVDNPLSAALASENNANPALASTLKFWSDLAEITPTRLEEVRAVLAKFFGPVAQANFIEPLVRNFISPSIPAPSINGVPGGVVNPSVATSAWAESGGDLVNFADNLIEAIAPTASSAERTAYRGALIRYFGQQFAKLDNLVQSQKEIRVASPMAVGHLGMDSRIGEGFPAEWVEYMNFSDASQRAASNILAINSAFGRDMQDLRRNYETIEHEIRTWADEYRRLVQVVGGNDRRSLLRHLREFGDANQQPVADPKAWLSRREAAQSAEASGDRYTVTGLEKLSGNLINPDKSVTGGNTLGMEIFDTIVAGLLAAPKSAVKNLSSIIDLVTFFRTPGFASLRTMATGGASSLRLAIGSAVSVFGIDAFKNSLMLQRLDRIGQLDRDRFLTARQITNELGHNNHAEQTRSGRIQAKLRAARNLLTQYTIKPLGRERGEIRAVGMRGPFGIFTWSQHITNLACAEAIFAEFDRLVTRALIRADRDPAYLDGLRAGQLIKGEDVGYTKGIIFDDRGAFEALQDHARQMGQPLEQLVVEAAERRAQGLDIFSDDTLSRLYSRAVTEVTLESSVVNNPVPIHGSTLGRVSFRLFRWSWAKMIKIFSMFKSPEGRRDFRTAMNGLMAIGLIMLPAGVLFSLMLEEYDEEVTGKASNLRPLGGSFENTLYSILERMTVTGTFGFAADLGNSVLNTAGVASGGAGRDGGVFSVDNRVVLLSLINGLNDIVSRGVAQGWDNLTYASFYRQLIQTGGGGGALQYAQIINKLANRAGFDAPFDEEAKVVARINTNNLLRASGRLLKFEGRAAGGAARSNEATPHITDMLLSAMTDDREAFRAAYRRAVAAAREMGQTDPVNYVRRSFASRHPLKSLFRSPTTATEIGQLYAVMGEEYASQVRAALGNINRYGLALGIEPFRGADPARRTIRTDQDIMEFRRSVVALDQ